MPPYKSARLGLRFVLTLGIGAAGGGAFHYLGLPAPWMAGPMAAVSVAALSGAAAAVPTRLRGALFVALGMTLGARATPETVSRATAWGISLSVLAVATAAMHAAGYWVYRRIGRFDPATAFLSATPGSLSAVLSVVSDPRFVSRGAVELDTDRVVRTHSIRLFILVALTPLIAGGLSQTSISAVPAAFTLDWGGMALVCAMSTVAGWGLERSGVPGGMFLGALIASAACTLGGVGRFQPPDAAAQALFLLLGCTLGARFAGTGWREVARLFPLAAGATALCMALAAAIGGATALAVGLPFGQMAFAYAPGGLEAMSAMAFMLGYDAVFVSFHSAARVIGLSVATPVAFYWLRRTSRTSS